MTDSYSSYSVDTAALADHARTVSDLAAQLREVFDSTGQTTIDANTYGETLRSTTSTIMQLNDDIRATVQAGGVELDSASATLNSNVAAYEQQETTTADSFNALAAGIDTGAGGQQSPQNAPAEGVPMA